VISVRPGSNIQVPERLDVLPPRFSGGVMLLAAAIR
jgi:hypothetical protein